MDGDGQDDQDVVEGRRKTQGRSRTSSRTVCVSQSVVWGRAGTRFMANQPARSARAYPSVCQCVPASSGRVSQVFNTKETGFQSALNIWPDTHEEATDLDHPKHFPLKQQQQKESLDTPPSRSPNLDTNRSAKGKKQTKEMRRRTCQLTRVDKFSTMSR